MIHFKLADIKLESPDAYVATLKKNLSCGFQVIDIFCKNAVLIIYRYLKRFYTYRKINSIYLKFDHSLNNSCRKINNTKIKNITNK